MTVPPPPQPTSPLACGGGEMQEHTAPTVVRAAWWMACTAALTIFHFNNQNTAPLVLTRVLAFAICGRKGLLSPLGTRLIRSNVWTPVTVQPQNTTFSIHQIDSPKIGQQVMGHTAQDCCEGISLSRLEMKKSKIFSHHIFDARLPPKYKIHVEIHVPTTCDFPSQPFTSYRWLGKCQGS